jgi:hypothetical protein
MNKAAIMSVVIYGDSGLELELDIFDAFSKLVIY